MGGEVTDEDIEVLAQCGLRHAVVVGAGGLEGETLAVAVVAPG
jgi:hypothetical protein